MVEAPDARRRTRDGTSALEVFARHVGLRTREVMMGFHSHSQQEIALLYDPAVLTVRHDPQGGEPPRFDGTWRVAFNGNPPEPIVWAKPPLEIERSDGQGARAAPDRRPCQVQGSARRPHRGPCRPHRPGEPPQAARPMRLAARPGGPPPRRPDPLIVLGDFNDGPGQDAQEEVFGRSGVEIVLGEKGAVHLHDPHARLALCGPSAASPTTARFRVPPDGRWLSALLDYVMVSPDLRALKPAWRIWHPFDDPACWADESLRRALLHASDHFPVTLDIDL